MEPTAPDSGRPAEASDLAARRTKVQRAVGGAAVFGGAVAVIAGIGLVAARLLGRKRA